MIDSMFEQLYGNTLTDISDINQASMLDENTVLMRIEKLNKDVLYVYLDIDDYLKCKPYKWYAVADHNTFYAMAGIVCSDGVRRMVKMHRFIMFDDVVISDKSVMIDHINRNGLDNRRVNLRFTDNRGNQYNARISSLNTTGVTGVSYSEQYNTFFTSMRLQDGRRLQKSYSANKYGYDEAKRLSINKRKEWEEMHR